MPSCRRSGGTCIGSRRGSGTVEPACGVLCDQGDLPAAQAAYERALAIDEAVYGADHPEVATDLTALAGVLYAQGDLDRARRLHERALAICEARLGADHPDTVRSREDLAAVVAALDERR